jgi:hypothetical protein
MASRKDILTYIRNKTRESYNRVNLLLTSNTSSPSHASSPTDSHSIVKECTKKKRKSMHELKMYTGGSARKRSKTRDKDSYKGWSEEGKACVVTMISQIKCDRESRNHEEWEKMYRKVCSTVRTPKEDKCEGNGNGNEYYKSVLYCEVSYHILV